MQLPPRYESILAKPRDLQFTMNSDVLTGDLLRTLVSTKPAGRVLEEFPWTWLDWSTGIGLLTSCRRVAPVPESLPG